ncbi:hypothetical protein L1987_18837 [Smallanthus sonchifolius]|uniref:Uncharacterized protein n=1 Tax=Smallanthus sonchifolius TaxID=185202 RepID=A0ACB9J4B4_9ASTR|nr:hypothetical protein L1987_18837 [Smallanthus sonchifolius]
MKTFTKLQNIIEENIFRLDPTTFIPISLRSSNVNNGKTSSSTSYPIQNPHLKIQNSKFSRSLSKKREPLNP